MQATKFKSHENFPKMQTVKFSKLKYCKFEKLVIYEVSKTWFPPSIFNNELQSTGRHKTVKILDTFKNVSTETAPKFWKMMLWTVSFA